MDTQVVTREELERRYRRTVPALLRDRVRQIAIWAAESGGRCALVGGPVRDLILDIDNIDVDLAVECDVGALARRAAAEWGCTSRYHTAFETATLIFEDDTKIDLARTRSETYAVPGALPDIRPATLENDLRRRDFTINAMALVIRAKGFGPLIDPFDGQGDLCGRVVRVLHDPSFVDDPTRIFRAMRFAGRLGFSIERRTTGAMREAIANGGPALVGEMRLLREFRLILAEDRPTPALRRIRDSGAARFFHPLLDLGAVALRRLSRAADFCARYADDFEMDDVARNAVALAWTWPGDEVRAWFTALGLSSTSARKSASDIDRSDADLRELGGRAADWNDARLLVCDDRGDEALAVLAVSGGPVVRRRVARYWALRDRYRVLVGGNDLRKLGIPVGPEIGRLLAELRKAVWNGKAGLERESQMAWIQNNRHAPRVKTQ